MTRVSFAVTHPQYFDRIRGSVHYLGNEIRGTAIKKRLLDYLDLSLHWSLDVDSASAVALLMPAILPYK